MPAGGHRVIATQVGQNCVILPRQTSHLSLLLNENQLDLDQAIRVENERGDILFEGSVHRTSLAI